jgi:hypothetical protein
MFPGYRQFIFSLWDSGKSEKSVTIRHFQIQLNNIETTEVAFSVEKESCMMRNDLSDNKHGRPPVSNLNLSNF